MTPEALRDLVLSAIASLAAEGSIPVVEVPDAVTVERPKIREHGDYATNAALILAKHPGLTPFELKAILAAIADNPRPRARRSKPTA